MTDTPKDPEDFDIGWVVEGEDGQVLDLGKLPTIIQDRIDRFPDQDTMRRWVTEHPGVNARPVEGVEGAWVLYLEDHETREEFAFGEFRRDDLLA
jgi:hypothetical protein